MRGLEGSGRREREGSSKVGGGRWFWMGCKISRGLVSQTCRKGSRPGQDVMHDAGSRKRNLSDSRIIGMSSDIFLLVLRHSWQLSLFTPESSPPHSLLHHQDCCLGSTLAVALQYQGAGKKRRVYFVSRAETETETETDLATAALSAVCLSTLHKWLPIPPLRQAEKSLASEVLNCNQHSFSKIFSLRISR